MHRFLLLAVLMASMAAVAPRALGGMPWCPWGCCGASAQHSATLTQVSQTSDHKPSMLARMSSGTKRLVSSTKSIFSPKKPAAKKPRAGTAGGTYSLRQKEQEPSFFRKLFSSEPPPPPKTVKEWMSLEQVHP
jgi:hypothetical protein